MPIALTVKNRCSQITLTVLTVYLADTVTKATSWPHNGAHK